MKIRTLVLLFISQFAAGTELSYTIDKVKHRVDFDNSRVILSSEAGSKTIEFKKCGKPLGAKFMNSIYQTVTPPPAKGKSGGKGIEIRMSGHQWQTAKTSAQGKFILKLQDEVEHLATEVAKACEAK